MLELPRLQSRGNAPEHSNHSRHVHGLDGRQSGAENAVGTVHRLALRHYLARLDARGALGDGSRRVREWFVHHGRRWSIWAWRLGLGFEGVFN